jgi:hypothetical protein
LVEVKPYYSIDDFKNHPCMKYFWGVGHKPNGEIVHIPADSSAAFGVDPSVVYWEMCHGAGGGVEENIEHWVNCDVEQSWKKAGNIVQYKVRA